MSVGEIYAIAVSGFEEGLAVAERLAAHVGALPRWAATWTTPAQASHLRANCDRLDVMSADYLPFHTAYVSSPTMDEVRSLIAHGHDAHPLCIHFSPVIYIGDVGPEASWISYIGHDGLKREDAKVYAIEVAREAVPLTTPTRPDQGDFEHGPQTAKGWALRVSVVRDHMPPEQLTQWLAMAAGLRPESCAKVVFD